MESKNEDLNDVKSIVRSILLSLGRTATVRDYLTEFKNLEGIEFKKFLDNLGMNLHQFLTSIPDVCRLKRSGENIYIERVSTEATRHMDHLTIVKKVRNLKIGSSPNLGVKMVTSSARKYHRANTFPMSKPKTASKITSRPPYVTVSVKPLPLPLSKTMKPIIFKGIQEDLIHKQEQDLTRIAEVSDTFLEQKQSRVGLTEEMKKLISTDSIGQHDSEESNLWTDDDEKAEITCQIQVPRISRNSFVKNVAFLPKMPEKKKQIPTATISNSNTKDVATSNQIAADIPEAKICEIPNQLFFEVLLVDAVTPSQFTFIYNAKNFQTMKNEMSLHYKSLKDSKDLVISKIVPGMPVAVSHNNQWKRAVVVVISDSDVFVHFIDEGTKTYVKANRLRYLEKTFAEHPRMCYKGSLFGVNPKNGEKLWSGDAMKFMSKLNGRKMFASIKNLQNDFFQLLLVKDVFKQEQLSDHVIRAGLADLATNSVRFKNGVLEG